MNALRAARFALKLLVALPALIEVGTAAGKAAAKVLKRDRSEPRDDG